MTIRIIIDGTRARAEGLTGPALTAAREATSFDKEGADFARRRFLRFAHKRKLDKAAAKKKAEAIGVVNLMRAASGGVYTMPAGLGVVVADAVRDAGYEAVIEDERPPLSARRSFGFEGGLRRYQVEAVRAFATGNGDPSRAGAGMLKHSIRSGKTRTAARAIAAYGRPALFLVTSKILMRQARDVLTALLPGASVTCVGEGERDVSGDVVVSTVQSLVYAREKKLPEWRELRRREVVVFDEVHHLDGAERWLATALALHARVRLGLSATVWPGPDDKSAEVLLSAVTGPVLHEVSMAQLMGEGFLVPATVRFRRVLEPMEFDHSWSRGHWDRCVFKNEVRNAAIVEEVVRAHESGLSGVIVTTNRIPHAELLAEKLVDAGMRATFLVGPHDDDRRQAVIQRLRERKLDVVVSTVLSEGVDVPECEAVVVGDAGKSRRAALQRFRSLTPAPGKDRALLVDFLDMTSDYFSEHSMERLRAYKAEKCFAFEYGEP